MTDKHPYKYIVDNGVIADPLMKEWINFEDNLFNRLFTPQTSSLRNISLDDVQLHKNKINDIEKKFTSIRKIMYKILDELNDPFYFHLKKLLYHFYIILF